VVRKRHWPVGARKKYIKYYIYIIIRIAIAANAGASSVAPRACRAPVHARRVLMPPNIHIYIYKHANTNTQIRGSTRAIQRHEGGQRKIDDLLTSLTHNQSINT